MTAYAVNVDPPGERTGYRATVTATDGLRATGHGATEPEAIRRAWAYYWAKLEACS